jgi:Na+/melibiose symporter-like transporter
MKKLNPEREKKRQNKIFYNKLCYLLLAFHTGVSTLSDMAIQFFFKDELKLEPGSMSQVLSISLIPWMLKPFLGLLTDTCPILGYRRKYYIIICGFVDILCWIMMAFNAHSILVATILLFMINACLAFSTVLGEAIVVELSKMNEDEEINKNDRAKDYISSFFLIKDIGALASSYLKGYFVDIMSIRTIFLISATTPIIIVIAGFLIVESKRRSPDENKEFDRNIFIQENLDENNKKNSSNDGKDDIVILDEENNRLLNNKDVELKDDSYISTSQDHVNNNLMNNICSFICQSKILVPTMFIIAFMAVPSYDDPLFYFITNHLHFNGNIIGQISFISALTAIIAILIYKTFFKHVGFKTMIIFGTILYFSFSFTAYMLVTEFYKKLCISPYIMALFSSATVSMIGELVMMPILSLGCILCPPNLEATVYSLFMSAINFGSILSYTEASFLTKYYGITSTNFQGLPKLILLSNFCGLLPLLILLCINDKYFTSDECPPEQEKEKIESTKDQK